MFSYHWLINNQLITKTRTYIWTLRCLSRLPRVRDPGQRSHYGTTIWALSGDWGSYLDFNWFESHSRPSYRPSPLVAQVAWMYHVLFLRPWRPSLSVTSAAFMALGRSWNEGGQKNVTLFGNRNQNCNGSNLIFPWAWCNFVNQKPLSKKWSRLHWTPPISTNTNSHWSNRKTMFTTVCETSGWLPNHDSLGERPNL